MTGLEAALEPALEAGDAAAEADPASDAFLVVFLAGFLGDLEDIVFGSSLQPGMPWMSLSRRSSPYLQTSNMRQTTPFVDVSCRFLRVSSP